MATLEVEVTNPAVIEMWWIVQMEDVLSESLSWKVFMVLHEVIHMTQGCQHSYNWHKIQEV